MRCSEKKKERCFDIAITATKPTTIFFGRRPVSKFGITVLAMPCASVTTLGYKSNAITVGNQIVQCDVATEKEKLLS